MTELATWMNRGSVFQSLEPKDAPHNLPDSNTFTLPKAETNFYGTESIRSVCKKSHKVLLIKIKEFKSLEIFKQNKSNKNSFLLK